METFIVRPALWFRLRLQRVFFGATERYQPMNLRVLVPVIPATFDGARTIPSARVTDLMAEALGLTKEDKLLEIGTGSGYQTAAWAKSGCEVHSIELEPWVSEVSNAGCTTIYLHAGDGKYGLPHEAPFSALVATCGIECVPDAWRDQLGDGGRLVAPIGDAKGQRLTLFFIHKHELVPVRVLAYVRFQMMREKPVPKTPRYHAGEN